MEYTRVLEIFEDMIEKPYTKQFKIELGPAKRAEQWVKNTLEKEYGTVMEAEDLEVHYDLLIRKLGKKVEIKYDKKSKETGNLAIETESYGKYKGIMRSKSDWYAIVCYDKGWKCLIIPTALLRGIVEEGKYPVVAGGDNKQTKVALIPIQTAKQITTKEYPIR